MFKVKCHKGFVILANVFMWYILLVYCIEWSFALELSKTLCSNVGFILEQRVATCDQASDNVVNIGSEVPYILPWGTL